MLCDTHTAVALKCALEYMEKQQPAGKMLVVSTASAYKFAPSVLDSLGAQVPEDEFDSIEALMQKTDTRAPLPLLSLKDQKVRFDQTIETDSMEDAVFQFIQSN